MNGENLTAKTPPGDFQVTTPETPLLTQQVVTSKGIPSTLPTYSWTLTPTPNWTCFVVTVPLSDARLLSTWLTNCANPNTRLQSPTKKVVGCKVLKWARVWLQLPQAQVNLSHLSWPNPICNRNLISQLNIYIYIYVIRCGKKSAIVMIPNNLASAAVWES